MIVRFLSIPLTIKWSKKNLMPQICFFLITHIIPNFSIVLLPKYEMKTETHG